MARNRTGAGRAFIRKEGLLIPLFPLDISWEEEVESEVSQGYVPFNTGVLQTLATIKTSSQWNLTYSGEFFNTQSERFMMWGIPDGTSSTLFPKISTSTQTVPATPHSVSVSGLTADQSVDVTLINDDGSITYLTQVDSSGTPSAGEFIVEADTITFNAAEEGASFAYYYQEALSAASVAGADTSVDEYAEFEIIAAYKLTTTPNGKIRRIWWPNCSFEGGGIGSMGGADALERSIVASVPTALGWNYPFCDLEEDE